MPGDAPKLPLSGVPRITRPRRRPNQHNLGGFTVVDPGGNWLRIFPARDTAPADEIVAELRELGAEVPAELV